MPRSRLLRAHTCAVRLSCPLYDFRPEHDDGKVPRVALDTLTSATECDSSDTAVRRRAVPGTHWTMLFGAHAAVVGEAVMQLLGDLKSESHLEDSDGVVDAEPTILGATVIEHHFEQRSASTPLLSQASAEVLRHLRISLGSAQPAVSMSLRWSSAPTTTTYG